MAISFAGSFGPGGICSSPSCRNAPMRTLSPGLPGTTAGPRVPPFSRLSRSRKEICCRSSVHRCGSPGSVSSGWAPRACRRNGHRPAGSRRSAREAKQKKQEAASLTVSCRRRTDCPRATTLPFEIMTSSSFSLCTWRPVSSVQRRDDLLRRHVDDFARGGVGKVGRPC